MKTGKILRKTKIKGKEVVFRYPKFEDLDDLLKVINSLVAEKAMLSVQKKKTREEEMNWLSFMLKKIEKNEAVYLLVELAGEVMGGVSIKRSNFEANKHVGEFGIALKKEARGLGLGDLATKLAIREAKKELGVKIILLRVFATNKRAIRLYQKNGFQKIGEIKKGRKHYGRYIDEILMAKYL